MLMLPLAHHCLPCETSAHHLHLCQADTAMFYPIRDYRRLRDLLIQGRLIEELLRRIIPIWGRHDLVRLPKPRGAHHTCLLDGWRLRSWLICTPDNLLRLYFQILAKWLLDGCDGCWLNLDSWWIDDLHRFCLTLSHVRDLNVISTWEGRDILGSFSGHHLVLDQREVLRELLTLKYTLIFDPNLDLVAHLYTLNRRRRGYGILLLNCDDIVCIVHFTYVEVAETS